MRRYPRLLLLVALALCACGSSPEQQGTTSKKKATVEAPTKADDKPDDKPQVKPQVQPNDENRPPDRATIARGKYLAEVVMACQACHTPVNANGPDLARSYAGGLEYTDTFGTWRSPNITQDRQTGIGEWTDEQIIAAVREGKRPSGEQLYPIMPYPYFRVATDEDMHALVAYLRTVGPIENTVAGNSDLKLTKPAHQPAAPSQPGNEPASQGQYLAQLAHCDDCHTPLNADGARDETKRFAGGRAFTAFGYQGKGKVWSTNITPDPETGVGAYTKDELIAAILDPSKRAGSATIGRMSLYMRAWSKLEQADLEALTAYLHTVTPVNNTVPTSTWHPPAP